MPDAERLAEIMRELHKWPPPYTYADYLRDHPSVTSKTEK